jgi:hypothetical protein
MMHTLVIPNELEQKLIAAHGNATIHRKWLDIGVDTVEEMENRIKDRLNENNPKLEITSIRKEDKSVIKERINNSGRVSMFAGYLENANGIVDALFFYVDPDAGNANDFLASKIPPVILGIYRNHARRKRDLHINNMPIYVVSVCTSTRVGNASVKQQIICAETMGIKYIDVFDNPLYDIINRETDVDEITGVKTIRALSELVSQTGTNDSFQVDEVNKTLSIICENMLQRSNDTAYIYRWFLKCIPAIYLASSEGYRIDVSAIRTLTSGDISLIREYIEKYPRTI